MKSPIRRKSLCLGLLGVTGINCLSLLLEQAAHLIKALMKLTLLEPCKFNMNAELNKYRISVSKLNTHRDKESSLCLVLGVYL